MPELLGGFPKTVLQITDNSAISNAGLKGVIAVLGITQRGEPGKPVIIRSWDEYRRFYGNLVSYSLFPLFCKRALERGGTLMVTRVAHYTDITDLGTATGVKATATLTVSTNSAVFTAKSHGIWGNSIKVTTTAAASGLANAVDILVEILNDQSQSQLITDVPTVPTAPEKDAFNGKSRHVTLGTVTNLIPVGNVTLSTGTDDYSALTDSDYLGDSSTLTGLHAYDNFTEPVKICVPEITEDAVNVGLVNYVTSRGDMLAILRTPSATDGYDAIDFRNKTGAYAGDTKIDNWRGLLFYGDIKVTDPLTNSKRDISAIGDILGIMSAKDAVTDPWRSFAGKEFGRLTNYVGVVYNLFPAARRAEADKVLLNRVNPVVEHSALGAVIWGSETLQVAETLLKHANIAELLIYLARVVPLKAQEHLFKPNDIPTWRDIYRDVRDIMEDVANRQGVYGGEEVGWKYDGDQNVDNVADVVVNNVDDIQNGIYKFNLFIKPTPLAKYIGINISVTNIDVDYSVVVEA